MATDAQSCLLFSLSKILRSFSRCVDAGKYVMWFRERLYEKQQQKRGK